MTLPGGDAVREAPSTNYQANFGNGTPAGVTTSNDAPLLHLESRGSTVMLPVRVFPRSARTQMNEIRQGRLLVRLTQAPVDGAANLALLRLLAKALDVRRSAIRLAGGDHARKKQVLVTGLTVAELRRRVRAALSG